MFEKKKQISLMEFVVEQIENAILTKGLQPGDKLPPLREMQEMLGTSQGTLREALRVVEQKGLIEMKAGQKGGVFVKALNSDKVSESIAMLIRFKKISIEELAAFREPVETAAAFLAASSASKDDIRHLKELLSEMEKLLKEGVSEWLPFYYAEDRLHRALADMTGNALFESMVKTIAKNDYFALEYLPRELKNMQETVDDWRRIIESIEKKQPDEVANIIKTHIRRFARYMKETQKRSGDKK